MPNNIVDSLKQSLNKGFIDKNVVHEGNLNPKILINNKKQNVLTTILNELNKCNTFYREVSVFFFDGFGGAFYVLLTQYCGYISFANRTVTWR